MPILTMIVLVVLFIFGSFFASTILGPKRSNTAKRAPYECGIVPETEPVERFSTKFYLVAMAFIVLDVEIVFLYPFFMIYLRLGVYGLVAMGVFLLVALVPFAYLLSTGAASWGPAKQYVSRAADRVLRATGMPDVTKPATTDDEVAA